MVLQPYTVCIYIYRRYIAVYHGDFNGFLNITCSKLRWHLGLFLGDATY